MSRIGKKPIAVPEGVTITIDANHIVVKGPKGTLEDNLHSDITVEVKEGNIEFTRPTEGKFHRSIHGTVRALVNNMVLGVTQGFSKDLKMIGVGYRAAVQGPKLVLQAGYSHPVEMAIPADITVEVVKNTLIKIAGIHKQHVGEFSANVRKVRPPEPYLGKGIRYVDEYVRRKEGKTA
jgi:large subunit ribosomal protein L6